MKIILEASRTIWRSYYVKFYYLTLAHPILCFTLERTNSLKLVELLFLLLIQVIDAKPVTSI
jgi:hypothetical protein